MKICTKCKADKEESEFSLRSGSSKLRSICKQCIVLYAQTHYQNNKEVYKQRGYTSTKKGAEVKKVFLVEFLNLHPCVDCGESDIRTLEFHHRDPNEKIENISSMIRSYSLAVLKEEINKCDVLCANCHRKKTNVQFNWYREKLR